MFVFRLGPMSKGSVTEAMLVVLKVNKVDAQYSRTHCQIIFFYWPKDEKCFVIYKQLKVTCRGLLKYEKHIIYSEQ